MPNYQFMPGLCIHLKVLFLCQNEVITVSTVKLSLINDMFHDIVVYENDAYDSSS